MLVAVLLPASINAQTINGDLNHSGKLEVSDVTHLINNYLTGTAETIGGDPFAADNSLVVGTWYKSPAESITFNADGTTDYLAGCTYKFKPYQGYILFYNADGIPVSSLRVPEVTAEYLAVLPFDSDIPVIYSASSPETGGGTEDGHAWVDLGLPSGTLWATMNVGASSPEDYGDYYAWGEIETKSEYNWSTYKWCNGSSNTLTKYCVSGTYVTYGTVDNKTELETSDDVAYQMWGSGWRMPTIEQFRELQSECTYTWTMQKGVYGYKFASKVNSNTIFFPAAGKWDSSLIGAGDNGYYWSRSLYTSSSSGAQNLFFNSSFFLTGEGSLRFYGLSVRPVRK